MKSPMFLFRHVLQDMERECGISTDRDYKTVSARVEHEGLSFLTISLANFGKDFERSLDLGYVDSNHFLGFSRSGGLPAFLRGFLRRVFDETSGALLDNPDIACIRAIRQITLMFAKIELECTPARKQKAIDGYIECEQSVKLADASLDPAKLARFSDMAARLWGPALSKVENLIYSGEHIPFKHGSGQTADKVLGNAKFNTWIWTDRLEKVLPYGDHCLPSARYSQEYLPHVNWLEPGQEPPVKVTLVPKTLKTPRVIAMEPSWMMFVQQGLMAVIKEAIEEVPYLRDLVGWHTQVPNQDMACLSSKNGRLATLDLSEASDRVSNQHVLALFAHFPLLSELVQACRSTKADVPGEDDLYHLAKFASMGSALTFPVEAMVFMTLIALAVEDELNARLTIRDINSLVGVVRVYGDDLIVPVEYVSSVLTWLEDFGLRVNLGKSFWTGKFRESCGKEFYDGEDVSIFKMRQLFPTNRTDVDSIVSLYSLRNQAYQFGCWVTVAALDAYMEERDFPNPTVSSTSAVLGRHSFLGYETQRMCDRLHRPLVKGWVPVYRLPRNGIDDLPALFKCLSKASDLPFEDPAHLERSGRPSVRALKLRWAPPY